MNNSILTPEQLEADMFTAILKYWQSKAYGPEETENDIFSEFKHDILDEVVQEISQSIFDATDGWIRFPEDSVQIVDQSDDNE